MKGNIPLRHLLNEETLFIFLIWRSAIKKVNLSKHWITSRDSIELCIVWSDDGLFCFTKETKLFLTPNYSGMGEKCKKFRTLTLQSPNRYLVSIFYCYSLLCTKRVHTPQKWKFFDKQNIERLHTRLLLDQFSWWSWKSN